MSMLARVPRSRATKDVDLAALRASDLAEAGRGTLGLRFCQSLDGSNAEQQATSILQTAVPWSYGGRSKPPEPPLHPGDPPPAARVMRIAGKTGRHANGPAHP
jgi:hypothetical protein